MTVQMEKKVFSDASTQRRDSMGHRMHTFGITKALYRVTRSTSSLLRDANSAGSTRVSTTIGNMKLSGIRAKNHDILAYFSANGVD